MMPTRSRNASCSAASSGSNQGGSLQPNARWSSPARRHGRPGSKWSARSQPFLAPNTAPSSSQAPVQRARAAGRAPPCGCRAGSAGGSSSGRPRARLRGELAVAVDRAEAPRPVGVHVESRSRRSSSTRRGCARSRRRRRSRSARARPRPRSPRTPGIGPSSGLPSGVIASGWQSSRTTPACSRNGKRRIAPSSSGAKRSMSDGTGLAPCSQGTPSTQRARRVGLVAADQHAAGLGLAVDEVVGVAEAGRVARHLVARRPAAIATCWWSTGTDGMNAPDHRGDLRRPDPRRVDDVLGLDRAGVGVHGPHLAVAAPARSPCTRVRSRIRAPSARAASASAWVAMCGSTWPSPGIHTPP